MHVVFVVLRLEKLAARLLELGVGPGEDSFLVNARGEYASPTRREGRLREGTALPRRGPADARNARYLGELRAETGWFWLETALFVIAPLVLLNTRRVQASALGLYWTSALVVMGFMANRVNVSITGLLDSAGVSYVPKWTEYAASLAIFTAAVVAFRWAVLHLPIFPRMPAGTAQKIRADESRALRQYPIPVLPESYRVQ
jgi:hypothetical protein